jgi:hypothetical protein
MKSWQNLITLNRRISSKSELIPTWDSNPDEEQRPILVESWPRIVPSRRDSTGSCPPSTAHSGKEPSKDQPIRRHSFPESLGRRSQKRLLFFVTPTRSRRNSNMTATDHLEEELEKKRIENGTQGVTKYWVPLEDIQNLIRNAEVEKILRETRKLNDDSAHIKELKEFVFGKALRLFALLVSETLVQLLELFHQNDFGDEMFPIEQFKSTKPGWTIESMVAQEKRLTYEGREVKKKHIEKICQMSQWEFFVPIFEERNPVKELNQQYQMPFLREEETDKKNITNFSVVKHFVIHRSHLSFSNMSQIVRNDFTYYSIPI